jgi:glutamate--cysteine ligase
MPAIERWFRLEWMEHTPPFYSLGGHPQRRLQAGAGGHQPVPRRLEQPDAREMLPLAVQSAMAAIEKICPEAKNLLVIPENHTRNTFYLSNLAQLQRIFHMAGFNVRIGSINAGNQGRPPWWIFPMGIRSRWSRWCARKAAGGGAWA